MKIAISSDWHIMSEEHYQHTTNKEQLWEFLNWAEKEVDLTILAGDIFELVKDNWRDVKRDNNRFVRKIEHMIEDKELIYLYGNHDEKMSDIWDLDDRIILPNTDIMVLHGHQFDWKHKKVIKPFANFLVKASCQIEDHGWRTFTKNIFDVADKCGMKTLPDPTKPVGKDVYYERCLDLIANTPDVSRIVHAHTHRAYIEDGIIMNSGCATWGFSDYMLITDGKCELLTMEDGFYH